MLWFQEKIERNGKTLGAHISQILSQPSIDDNSVVEENSSANNMLSWRIENPVCKLSGCAGGFGDKDPVKCYDYVPESYVKLGYVERLPPYTTWIFLDRFAGGLCLFSSLILLHNRVGPFCF